MSQVPKYIRFFCEFIQIEFGKHFHPLPNTIMILYFSIYINAFLPFPAEQIALRQMPQRLHVRKSDNQKSSSVLIMSQLGHIDGFLLGGVGHILHHRREIRMGAAEAHLQIMVALRKASSVFSKPNSPE